MTYRANDVIGQMELEQMAIGNRPNVVATILGFKDNFNQELCGFNCIIFLICYLPIKSKHSD